MATRLFGVETEYAVAALDRAGRALERPELAGEILHLARRRLPHLPERLANGAFLACGARLYVDAGDHPEFSTPECTHPDEVVRYVRVGDRILAQMAGELAAARRELGEVVVLRSNVDLISGSSWGSHESHLHRTPERAGLPSQLIPHLVSRLIFCGAGGFNGHCRHGIEFTLAPRVGHLVTDVSADSTGARGIFHLKDEPLAGDGSRRLHLICGETLCSDLGLWLRLGTTALVVAMIEARLGPGDAVQLREPLAAMRAFAADPTLRAVAPRAAGPPMTALAIQRHYLDQARRHAGHACMPPWAGLVCERWGEVLDRLEDSPASLADLLDWPIKLALYRRHARRRGVAWASLPHWNHVTGLLASARQREPAAAERPLEALVAADSPIAATVAALGRYLAARGLSWDGLPAVLRLREELFELDARFGQLGERGVFATLDSAGALRHRLVEEDAVARGVDEPPTTSRALVRGTQVRALHARGGHYTCDWRTIWDSSTRRCLDLSDPFATEPRWVTQREGRARPTALDVSIAQLHNQGLGYYHAARYADALRLFQRAARLADAPPVQRLVAPSRFWAGTVLHNTGRLSAARAVLERARAGEVDDDTLYKCLARRLLVLIEQPAPRAEIEAEMVAAESTMTALGHADWRSRLLLARARLSEARGEHDAAVGAALEALGHARVEHNAMARPTYLRTVLTAALAARRWTDVGQLLDEMRGDRALEPTAALIGCAESALARVSGDAAAALAAAGGVAAWAEPGIDRGVRILVGETLVRALLFGAHVDDARQALGPLLALRTAEVASDRYTVHLLWADYQLARARRAAGLSPVEPLTGREAGERPARTAPPALSERRLRGVEQAYVRAAVEAERIDARLDTDLRRREVESRRELVAATRRAIDAGRSPRSGGVRAARPVG